VPKRAQGLSRAIVHLYPRAWRKRYSEEMLALIEDSGSTWMHALDLAAGCTEEWLGALLRSRKLRDYASSSAAGWGALLGAFMVRGVTSTAMRFSLIPPQPVRVVLQDAFWILVLFPIVGLLYLVFLNLKMNCKRWLRLRRTGQPMDPLQPLNVDRTPSPRQVWEFGALILILAAGADFTRIDYLKFAFPIYTVPMLAYFMLKHVRGSLLILRVLASRELAERMRE